MKIVTAEEMRRVDRATTEQYGVPSLTLMENAGAAVAEFAQKHFDFRSVCVVCGKGNNGGDGFVAARKLREAGKKVTVMVLAAGPRGLKGDAAKMFRKLRLKPWWIVKDADLGRTQIKKALAVDLIVDAILGTGFKPPLRGLARKAVELINKAPGQVVAVDVPSGVDADGRATPEEKACFVRADAVITFTAPKPAHVFATLTQGPVAVTQIGSPAETVETLGNSQLAVTTAEDTAVAFPPRKADSNKGDFGHVLVIGGSMGKAGAAAMAGMAALRAGAGLVTVASPASVQPAVAAFAPELMTEPLPETKDGTLSLNSFSRIQELIEGKDSLAIGPGLSRNPETAELVRKLVTSASVPMVLDADGLNAFEHHQHEITGEARESKNTFPRTLVLTPHPGEMARLTGMNTAQIQSDRIKIALDFAVKHKVTLVLKGARTITATPTGNAFINLTGNPGMAKGGSGDVLTGVVAALLAQHTEGEGGLSYASIAVYLHGLAGDVARDLYGENSMVATDIIDCLGEAVSICRDEAEGKFVYLQR
jgi:NAD(P)H-hydrate epimerase